MESSGFIIVSGMKSSTPALFKSQPFPFQMASKGKKNPNVPECSAGSRMICQGSFLHYSLFLHQQIM